MTLRLQRVRSVSHWDRPRVGMAGRYLIMAAIVRGWSYELWMKAQ